MSGSQNDRMISYRVSAPAEDQIGKVLAKSASDYGPVRAMNYGMLILAAMADVASDPGRLGAKSVPRSGGVWVYELWHSTNRLPRDRRVRDSWDGILYRVVPDDRVEILAVVRRSYPSSHAAGDTVVD